MTPYNGLRGASVNDGIEKELCSLKYVSVDEAMREVTVLGQGTQLAKLGVSGFSGMGIVEWWNGGMDFFSRSFLFARLCTNYCQEYITLKHNSLHRSK